MKNVSEGNYSEEKFEQFLNCKTDEFLCDSELENFMENYLKYENSQIGEWEKISTVFFFFYL